MDFLEEIKPATSATEVEQIRSAGPQEEIFKELAALQEISQGSSSPNSPREAARWLGKTGPPSSEISVRL